MAVVQLKQKNLDALLVEALALDMGFPSQGGQQPAGG